MSKYLYGAAVQGIQNFIFQTNKLKEIVGASELVERICTGLFAQVLYGKPEITAWEELLEDNNRVMNAAGNIKYIFDDEEACKRLVRVFPKIVMEFAPGITISQSVVKIDDKATDFGEAVGELERNLRAQRNKQMRDTSVGLMGVLRSRETGLPVTLNEESDERKDTTLMLSEKAFGFRPSVTRLPMDIKDMTLYNDWIAIIHADGNGLGTVVQKIGKEMKDFRTFSRLLDEATTTAAQLAFQEVGKEKDSEGKYTIPPVVPMRPIVLSGDDHTMICRADLAIPYTKAFIRHFEEQTNVKLGKILQDGSVFADESDFLTACAGVVFMKSSFPFYFGYRLAESLCERAKKDTKKLFNAADGNLPASCLMFHKIQDNFITDFDDIAERELKPQPNMTFEFGPYYLKEEPVKDKKRWTIDRLKEKTAKLQGETGNAVKSGLRKWMTLVCEDSGMAKQSLNRMKTLVKNDEYKEYIEEVTSGYDDSEELRRCPVYDMLALNTITYQITK